MARNKDAPWIRNCRILNSESNFAAIAFALKERQNLNLANSERGGRKEGRDRNDRESKNGMKRGLQKWRMMRKFDKNWGFVSHFGAWPRSHPLGNSMDLIESRFGLAVASQPTQVSCRLVTSWMDRNVTPEHDGKGSSTSWLSSRNGTIVGRGKKRAKTGDLTKVKYRKVWLIPEKSDE